MEKTPTVMLAGKPYDVPLLVPKQNREVIPALLKLAPLFRAEGGYIKDHYAEVTDLMMLVIYWAVIWPIKKGDGEDGIRAVSEMPITHAETLASLNVIRMQTGLFTKAPEGAEPGEAPKVEAA